jgi:Reverse transcriptase (RNA-dependent DNA polymerase)
MDTRRGVAAKRVISPLLSNIYLDPLDHLMAQRGFEMVRYADDFVIMCRSPEDAARALALAQEWTAEAGLTLHPTKTNIIDAKRETFDFLDYRFVGGKRFPRPKSMQKFKDSIRAKTKRTSGDSLTKIIHDRTRILLTVRPPTGEPCAGKPPARFGGGRDRNQSVLPTPIPTAGGGIHPSEPQAENRERGIGRDLWSIIPLVSIRTLIEEPKTWTKAQVALALVQSKPTQSPARAREASGPHRSMARPIASGGCSEEPGGGNRI